MIGVIGLGYVGLPLAVSLALSGRQVMGFDLVDEVVAALQSGNSHILDVSDADLCSALGRGLHLASDASHLSECSDFIICVPTPLSESGLPDIRHVESAVKALAPHVRRGTLVVLESTSYPGTTEEVVAEPLGRLTGLAPGSDFCVAFSPERVDPGNATFGLGNTPKIVSGLLSCCRDKAERVYAGVSGTVVPASGLREAELAKLLENTYRQVNIALMNEMVKFCHALEIDLHEAIRCAATKPFGFQPFFPGPGVGGHCIPIDPQYLAARVEDRLGHSFRFVQLAQEINDGMPGYVVERLGAELQARGGDLDGARVLLLGVTYKRDVADMRESPSKGIARALRAAGASPAFMDPFVDTWHVDGVEVPELGTWSEDSPALDAAVLVTDHSAFRDLGLADLAPFVLDTRGCLVGPNVVRM